MTRFLTSRGLGGVNENRRAMDEKGKCNAGGARENHIGPQEFLPRPSCTSPLPLLFPSTVKRRSGVIVLLLVGLCALRAADDIDWGTAGGAGSASRECDCSAECDGGAAGGEE